MIRLPLYPETPHAAVSKVQPLERDEDCTRCSFGEQARTTCMPAQGAPGGLLVVMDSPGRVDDQIGKGYRSASGKFIFDLVRRFWAGPVAFDYAIRCTPQGEIKDKHVEACRPYSAEVLKAVRPQRVLTIGNVATELILGHRPPLISARRSYAFLFDALDDAAPVFMAAGPGQAMRNRLIRAEYEKDIEWALTCDAPEPDYEAATYLVTNRAESREAVRALRKAPWVTYDVETFDRTGNSTFRIEALSVWPAGSLEGYTWTRGALQLPASELRSLCELLADVGVQKSTQNGKFDDRSVLAVLGVHVKGTRFDTRLGRKLLEPEASAKLDVMSYLVGHGGHKDEAAAEIAVVRAELNRLANPKPPLTPKGNVRKIKPPAFPVEPHVLDAVRAGEDPWAFAFGYVSPTVLYRYNARDAFVTMRCTEQIEPQVQADPQIYRVWTELTAKANQAVKMMEHWGIRCDRTAVEHFSAYCEGQLAQSQAVIDKYAPGLNPNSPKQVGELLFKKLKLRSTKQTKTGAMSTDGEVLEALAHKHPIVAALVKSRKYSKLNGTYARGMLIHIRDDGRIHPSILIDGARTGRFSCSDPNLQNIPRAEGGPEDVDAAMARNCFVSEKGWYLLELDYSQIELRVAAMLSGDPVMIADYLAGIDIHMNNATACSNLVWGIAAAKWETMSKKERAPYRSKIKTATFAKLYGKTVRALAREWGVNVTEVEKIDRAIWGRYKVLDRWTKEQISKARRSGYVETWWDGQPALRRAIPAIGDPDEAVRKNGENEAVNTPVQGTAANFMTASIPKILEWIADEGVPARLVLTVHDSVMLEVKKSALHEVAHACRRIMRSHNSLGVPIEVDAKFGTAWGSMAEFSFAA